MEAYIIWSTRNIFGIESSNGVFYDRKPKQSPYRQLCVCLRSISLLKNDASWTIGIYVGGMEHILEEKKKWVITYRSEASSACITRPKESPIKMISSTDNRAIVICLSDSYSQLHSTTIPYLWAQSAYSIPLHFILLVDVYCVSHISDIENLFTDSNISFIWIHASILYCYINYYYHSIVYFLCKLIAERRNGSRIHVCEIAPTYCRYYCRWCCFWRSGCKNRSKRVMRIGQSMCAVRFENGIRWRFYFEPGPCIHGCICMLYVSIYMSL